MGKASRDKGYRGEAAVVRKALEHGVAANRVPLSGAVQGYPGDVILHSNGVEWTFEVKVRKSGFKQIYGWLDGNDGLVIKSDHHPELVVLNLEDFLDLLAGKHGGANEH